MIGVIGFGRFGKLITKYFASDFRVLVHNRSDKSAEIEAVGAVPASFEAVCKQRFLLLCVPISALRQALIDIAPLIRPDALVADVCSVKIYPTQWMREILPESVSILPTHPMFGPDSAADSLHDRKIVLCRERIPETLYKRISAYLMTKGLIVIDATPENHDRQIAVSLSMTHFIGRALEAFKAEELIIDTEGYKRLLKILDVVTHDTWQLFEDMHRFNPYAQEKRIAFMEAMRTIENRLSGSPSCN